MIGMKVSITLLHTKKILKSLFGIAYLAKIKIFFAVSIVNKAKR